MGTIPSRPWQGPIGIPAPYKETRRVGLHDGELHAQIPAPPYLTLPVWSRATIALAYASRLIVERRYDDAEHILHDETVRVDGQAAQWHQFIVAALFHETRRWPDVLEATAMSPPASATAVLHIVTDAVRALSAAAAASLGHFQSALDVASQICTTNPCLCADVALTKGWCWRELGDEDAARAAFQAAAADGRLLEPARRALEDPAYRMGRRSDRMPGSETT